MNVTHKIWLDRLQLAGHLIRMGEADPVRKVNVEKINCLLLHCKYTYTFNALWYLLALLRKGAAGTAHSGALTITTNPIVSAGLFVNIEKCPRNP